jgi:nucleoside-diphosphate-sugar epimerase
MAMKVLVTGATGRVGSRLVPRLLRQGHEVRILVRSRERAEPLTALGAEPVVGDLLEPDSLKPAVRGAEAVVHLAAFFRGASAEEAHAVNLTGTVSLANAALEAGVPRFVYTSTNLVYGPGQGRKFTEADLPNPDSAYPESKAASERALLKLHQSHGLGLRILRLAFVYGDGDPHLSEGLMWFRNWNPSQRFQLVHHADVAQAVLLALNADNRNGEIYNVADDEPAVTGDILRLLNEPLPDDADKRPIDAAWEQPVDTSKIKEHLGFRPIYPTLHSAVLGNAL